MIIKNNQNKKKYVFHTLRCLKKLIFHDLSVLPIIFQRSFVMEAKFKNSFKIQTFFMH